MYRLKLKGFKLNALTKTIKVYGNLPETMILKPFSARVEIIVIGCCLGLDCNLQSNTRQNGIANYDVICNIAISDCIFLIAFWFGLANQMQYFFFNIAQSKQK